MSCSAKTCRGAPIESHLDFLQTTPSSGSAHNSQCPRRQTSRPLSPALRLAVRSLAQSFPLRLRPCSPSPSFPRQRPPVPFLRQRFRCLPPAPPAPPRSFLF